MEMAPKNKFSAKCEFALSPKMLEALSQGRAEFVVATLQMCLDSVGDELLTDAVDIENAANFRRAIAHGWTEESLTKFLIEKGVDLKDSIYLGGSPLLSAALHGSAGALRALADVCDPKSTMTKLGETALMVAAWGKKESALETLAFLLPLSDPAARDDKGFTAFLHAAIQGHLDALATLLPVSDAKAQDKEGSSALMHVAAQGNIEGLLLLLPHSDIEAKTIWGTDAFGLCMETRNWQCVDTFANWIPADRAREAVEQAPPGALPGLSAAVARAERRALEMDLATQEGPWRDRGDDLGHTKAMHTQKKSLRRV